MKKILLLLTTVFFSIISFAQPSDIESPDYKKIEQNIKQENSNLYYPSLMKRYNNGDSTLTIEEKRHLYYGYTFQDKYNPYLKERYFEAFMAQVTQRSAKSKDIKNSIHLGDLVLKENPFNLLVLDNLLNTYDQAGDYKSIEILINKMYIITDAILSSGDGIDTENAMYIINIADAYSLLGIFDYRFGGKETEIEECAYIELADNSDNINGLYFNIRPCLYYLSKNSKK